MMKKYLLLLLMPVLLASTKVVSTEIDFTLSNQEKYQLNYAAYSSHFSSIPTNPNLHQTISTYSDFNLTEKVGELQPNQSFQIQSLQINDNNQQVFLLDTNEYILADEQVIYDDVILTSEVVEQTVWLKKGVVFYSSPISNQQKEIKTSYKAYQSVPLTEIVTTQLGRFGKISDQVWVSMDDISEEDNRMEAVQELLNTKYNSPSFGIYVKQLTTQKTAGISQNNMMYAASLSKLPVLYYTQEQVNQEKYKLTEGLKYVDGVVNFDGSYAAEGSGSLSKTADNAYYRIDDLINKVAKESDNAASNLLAYYMTNQFDANFYKTITAITQEKWDMKTRQASPEMAGLMMEAIYQQNGYVLESLKSTNFDNQRISRDISVPVAHKIGDAYDYKHDVAIVYADSPFILSIFTNQSDYETISQIANDIYGILK